MVEDAGIEQEARPGFWGRERYLAGVAMAFVAALVTLIFVFWERVEDLENYGYLGVFAISLLASATIFVPVPAIAVVFALGSVLNPVLVGLAAGLAEPIGELTSYIAGYSGRVALSNRTTGAYARMVSWMQRRGSLVLFTLSAVPNPIFDLAGLAAGALRFPLWKFLLICWPGKTIKCMGIALAGYWGLHRLLGIAT